MPKRRSQPAPADWSRYLPPEKRRKVVLQVWLHRFRSRLRQRSVLLLFMLLAYLAICLGLALWGVQTIGLLALTPLLLTPLVAYLAYWLVWREFHE